MSVPIPDIAERLSADCERIAVHLFGEPNRHMSNRREWRWGEHGRFRLSRSGPKRGKWNDFGSGEYGDMLDLVKRELGLDRRGAIDWSRDWLGGDIGDYPVIADRVSLLRRPAADPDADRLRRRERAFGIWAEAMPITGTLAEKYLREERGLLLGEGALAADTFRYHPKLYFGGGKVPGLVALMRDPVTARPVGVQRTYLTSEAKKIERRMLGSAGVVMLSPNEEVSEGLGLAEGMENGLAVMNVSGWLPVWAAMSAGAIRNFPVLPGVVSLTIFADPEMVGMNAARACAERWSEAGKEVAIVSPKRVDRDWNDQLRGAA